MSEPDIDLAHVWHGAMLGIEDSGIPARDRAYLRLARLAGLVGDTALLAVPLELARRRRRGMPEVDRGRR